MRYAWVFVLSIMIPATSWTQNAKNTPQPTTGLKLGKVPDLLYAQFPRLQHGCGLVVIDVKPKSMASDLGLRPYDIVLSCDNVVVKTKQQLLYLIAQNAGEKIPVHVLRQGRTLKFNASPSIAWQIAVELPKAVLKPGGPPAIRVTAEPLARGRYKIDFQYYYGSGKLKTLHCNGTLDEIRKHVSEMNNQKTIPNDVFDLVGAALKRIGQLDTSKSNP